MNEQENKTKENEPKAVKVFIEVIGDDGLPKAGELFLSGGQEVMNAGHNYTSCSHPIVTRYVVELPPTVGRADLNALLTSVAIKQFEKIEEFLRTMNEVTKVLDDKGECVGALEGVVSLNACDRLNLAAVVLKHTCEEHAKEIESWKSREAKYAADGKFVLDKIRDVVAAPNAFGEDLVAAVRALTEERDELRAALDTERANSGETVLRLLSDCEEMHTDLDAEKKAKTELERASANKSRDWYTKWDALRGWLIAVVGDLGLADLGDEAIIATVRALVEERDRLREALDAIRKSVEGARK